LPPSRDVSATVTTPTETAAPSRAPRTALQRIFGKQPHGLLFILPYAAFLALIFAYPLFQAVWISLHDFFFTAPGVDVPKPFVGFDNYSAVLSDPAVRRSFLNVGIFLVINVPLTVLVSLVLASALNSAMRGRTFFRVAFFVPYVAASVAVVSVWLFLFSGGGLVNSILGPLAPDPSWLVNSAFAMPVTALYVTWKQLGFFVLLYLAALQAVPKERYESAAVDGAGAIRSWWSVTVPGVRSATFLVILLATITGANLFTEPYLLTGGGGPNGASISPVLLMYQKGIEQGQPDVASAIGVLLIIGVILMSIVIRRVTGDD